MQRTTTATRPEPILVKKSLSPTQYFNLRESFQVSCRRIRVHEYMHNIVQVRNLTCESSGYAKDG
jgi:hypothetical protein